MSESGLLLICRLLTHHGPSHSIVEVDRIISYAHAQLFLDAEPH